MGFIFGGNTGISGPEELQRRRDLAQAVIARNNAQQPRNIWEGLNSLATSIGEKHQMNSYDKAETEGRASAESAYAPVIEALNRNGKADNATLVNAASNPWLTDPQQDIVKSMLKSNIGGGSEFGLNLVYGKDANGNTVAFQASKDGGVRPVQFPEGVTPSPGLSFQDMGTYVLPVNTKTGETGAPMPKDVAGAEQAKAEGKGVGEAKVNLPGIEGAANTMLSTIDSLDSDPYLPNMVGPVAGKYLPNVTADAHRVQSKMDQIQGQTFLQAYNTLKGGGQITEVEGAKAEAAIARLNAAQDIKDYKAALAELRGVVSGAITRARSQAGQGAATAPAPDAAATGGNAMSGDPQFGQVVNGHKIGATATNKETGEVLTWDGNGWRQ